MKKPKVVATSAAAAVLIVLLVCAANAGSFLIIDQPQPSDVIVVLAGETDVRPTHALELLSQGYARRVLIDVPSESKIYNFTQLDLARKYIQGLPQASSVDVCRLKDFRPATNLMTLLPACLMKPAPGF